MNLSQLTRIYCTTVILINHCHSSKYFIVLLMILNGMWKLFIIICRLCFFTATFCSLKKILEKFDWKKFSTHWKIENNFTSDFWGRYFTRFTLFCSTLHYYVKTNIFALLYMVAYTTECKIFFLALIIWSLILWYT